MPEMTPSQKYLDTLLRYYEEEIMGGAYFWAMSRPYSDLDRTYKMELMARVERHAANAVLPLVQRYRLTPRTDTELHNIGPEDINDVGPDWDRFIAYMQASFPNYMPEFRALEEMGPEMDQSRLSNFLSWKPANKIVLDRCSNTCGPVRATPSRYESNAYRLFGAHGFICGHPNHEST